MKKTIALLLIAMMLGTGIPGLAGETMFIQDDIFIEDEGGTAGETGGSDNTGIFVPDAPAEEQRSWDSIGIQWGKEVVVGTTTLLSGYFSTDMWGHNTADMDVRALLHGYATVTWSDAYGMALDDTVVTEFRGEANADGSQTYVLTLSEGLCYNDGTRITAKDYIFSLLLTGSPVIRALGGTEAEYAHIVGYDAYRAGEGREVTGIRLLGDNMFSITVKPEYLNYFYALALLNVTPYPIGVIAPGCDIGDDGRGAYITASREAQGMSAQGFTPGEFGEAMLAKTLLDPVEGYVFNPRVTSGAYALESYNEETHEARFIINERYIGNSQGQKPHVERVTLRPVTNENMIEKLTSGEVTVLNKVTSGVAANQGLPLVQQGTLGMGNYLRTGFAFLSFACEQGVGASEAVRKAVAYCIDQTAFVASVVGSFNAMPVYGYYGLGQWMVNQSFDEEEGKPRLVVMDELAKLEKPYDILAARELLVGDGWILGEDGEAYVEGGGGIRYRQEEDGLKPLIIRWAKTANNTLSDATRAALEMSFGQIGIGLEVTEMPFDEMLEYYYRQKDRAYDMFFLASNFGYIFDPYYEFNTQDAYQGVMNTTGLRDETLMALAEDMRETQPTALREYTEKWLAFQTYWVEKMPMVPLYSNVYFDFYDSSLMDYNIGEHTSWAYAMPYVWVQE